MKAIYRESFHAKVLWPNINLRSGNLSVLANMHGIVQVNSALLMQIRKLFLKMSQPGFRIDVTPEAP